MRTRISMTLALTALLAAVLLATPAISSAGAAGGGKTQTLHYFSKDGPMKITKADGNVIRKAPFPEPQSGDVLEINSLLYVGNHRHHARHWSASTHLRCEFGTTGEPDCESQAAIGGSLLIFHGFPGTLIDGTGRYQGATGRVLSNKTVKGGSDLVAKIHLR